jgi:hypothetical protein
MQRSKGERPLLALPSNASSKEKAWETKRLACQEVYGSDKLNIFEQTLVFVQTVGVQENELKELEFDDEMSDERKREIKASTLCNCNYDPALAIPPDDPTIRAALFESERHYNEFMLQVLCCPNEMIDAAPIGSVTKLVRTRLNDLDFSASLYKAVESARARGQTLAGQTGEVAFIAGAFKVGTIVLGSTAVVAGGIAALLCFMAVVYSLGALLSRDELQRLQERLATIDKVDSKVQRDRLLRDFELLSADRTVMDGAKELWIAHKERVHNAIFGIDGPAGWAMDKQFNRIVIMQPAGGGGPVEYRPGQKLTVGVPGGIGPPN